MISMIESTVFNHVKTAVKIAIMDAFPMVPDIQPIITVSNPKFGDYQCNSPMALYKMYKDIMGDVQHPKQVADKVKDCLSTDIFSEITVSQQGFINLRLSTSHLQQLLCLELEGKSPKPIGPPLSCLVDFSSPNIAKEMHVGHLRSTILGESICRVLEYVGHQVLRVNHIGDWGTQFGMLIEYMKEKHPDFQNSPPNISDLTAFYREAKIRFDNDLDFKLKAQLAVPALQNGDKVARDAWKLFCGISRIDFQRLYDRFNIQLIERGESFYNDMLPELIRDLETQGHLTDADGAKCFFVENDSVPLMAVKADGGYGYDSTDLAAAKHRLVIEKHQLVIYVTDIGQESHFSKIFKAAKILEWEHPPENQCMHIGFGLVQGEDGKKFKTRSGYTVKLTDLLDEAVERCRKEISSRRDEEKRLALEQGENFTANNEEIPIDIAAQAIGYSAVRYFDLRQHRLSNYKFSYDKMLDPKGNTAVYLLYAYARICAIFRKSNIDPTSIQSDCLILKEVEERDLALQMLKFYDVINSVLEDFYLHRIAEYIYQLSGSFTTFYQHCKVIGHEYQNSRLLLCELTRRFLETSFYLLGITPLTRI